MNQRSWAFTAVLTSMIWLLASCGRGGDGAHDLQGRLYPLDLALTCNQSTPSPLRSDYPASDFGSGLGKACVERHSGADALRISKIDIHRDKAFRDPVYEVQLHIDPKDRKRMEKAMSKAVRSRRTLALMVHGVVVARALVTNLPRNGVIMMGGYLSVKEAEAIGARFEAPTPRSD